MFLHSRSDEERFGSPPDSLGLQTIYCDGVVGSSPSNTLVFVHGLGGHSVRTWTHTDSTFWPMWLPQERDIGNVRIMTFGYNANFNKLRGPKVVLSICDCATQLLESVLQCPPANGVI